MSAWVLPPKRRRSNRRRPRRSSNDMIFSCGIHLGAMVEKSNSILDREAGEQVTAQCVVNAGGHIAVHEQRIGGKSNDRRLLIDQIVDAQSDIQMLRDVDAAIEVEVVVGADLSIDRKGVARIR